MPHPFRHLPFATRMRRPQNGLALIFVLIMMTIVFSIVTITARIATQGDRAARNDRDRQIAFNAAEAGIDAALEDITGKRANNRYESLFKFGTNKPEPDPRKCFADAETRGFCGADTDATLNSLVPAYADKSVVDWDDESADRKYVLFGEYTDKSGDFGNNAGGMSAKLPRYIIQKAEIQTGITSTQKSLGNSTTASLGGYRGYLVTAVGFGANPETRVFLQALINVP